MAATVHGDVVAFAFLAALYAAGVVLPSCDERAGERASERYVRIGFGLFDPDPGEHDRRRDAQSCS